MPKTGCNWNDGTTEPKPSSGNKVILFPEKEYSRRMLDELNYIGYGFLESATEYLIDETDEEYLEQELKWYFPEYLVNQDPNRCFSKLKTLYEWIKDESLYRPVTRLHEYVLMRAIHNEWMFFNDLPDAESQELRETFYRLSGKAQLSEKEAAQISSMKDNELATMKAFFENMNFGELELIGAFHQEPLCTFLRF